MQQLTLTFVTLLVPLAVASTGDGGAPVRIDHASDDIEGMICGPLCARLILQKLGKEADLTALIREIQWPNLEQGTTLDALAGALENRGLYTHALRVAPGTRLRWPWPVLVHYQPHHGNVGHFAVWTPEPNGRGDDFTVWDPKLCCGRNPEAEFSRRMSGAVLLVAPGPITDPGSAVGMGQFERRCWNCAAILSFLLVAIWFGPALRERFGWNSWSSRTR